MPGANSKVGRIGENEGRALGKKALVQQPRLGSSRLHFQAIFLEVISFLIAFYRTRQRLEGRRRRAVLCIALKSSSAINKIDCTRGIRERRR